ncbi:Protein-associating with the carboxyl-terminal domain of ezrin [Dinochytrium kinnereticum]|nr:Protein-associating with the carboxyl-terminal domain of ezrin [Dinochytrium kinnereticum]
MGAAESKAHQSYHLRGQVPITTSETAHPQTYSIWNAVHKSTGESVCVFYCYLTSHPDGKGKAGLVDPRDRPLILNGIQKLKTIRHPGIIRFKDSEVMGDNVYLVTEPVIPLRNILRALPPEEILIGIHMLLQVSHNRINLDSLYVAETKTGRRWLLGGFELATSFDETPPSPPETLHRFMPPDSIPPEHLNSTLSPTQTPVSGDAYSLGQLISDIIAPFLNPSVASSPDSQVSLGGGMQFEFGWRELQEVADRMCAMNPGRRPDPESLLGMKMFKENAMLSLVDFFGRIRALTAEQKLEGFKSLPSILRSLPTSTINAYILPLFLSKELFNEPGLEFFFSELFSFKDEAASSPTTSHRGDAPLVPMSTYKQYVLPFAAEMLKVREFGLRLSMLKMFENYGQHLINNDPVLFQSSLVQEIFTGFEEYSDDIYVLTYKSACAMIPTLCLLPASHFRYTDSQGRIPDPTHNDDEADSPRSSYTAVSSDPRAKRSSTVMGGASFSGLTIPVANLTTPNWEGGGAGVGETLVPITTWIVDRNIVPKTVRCCVWEEEVSEVGQEVVLESVVGMWRRLCVIENETKRADVLRRVRPILRSCSQCFYLLLRVLPMSKRLVFLEETLIGDINSKDAIAWLPRIVELLIPFLKDHSRQMRQSVSKIMSQSIASISECTQLLGPLDKTDDKESNPYTDRLRRMYGKLPRRQVFMKSGPRIVFSAQPSTNAPKDHRVSPLDVERDDLWTRWDDDVSEEGEEGRKDGLDEFAGLGDALPAADTDQDLERLHRLSEIRKRREARGEEIRHKQEMKKSISTPLSTIGGGAAWVSSPSPKSRMPRIGSSGADYVPLVSGGGDRNASFSMTTNERGMVEMFVPRSEVKEGNAVSRISMVGVSAASVEALVSDLLATVSTPPSFSASCRVLANVASFRWGGTGQW